MLKQMNKEDNKKTIYECDRCKVEFLTQQRKAIFVQNGREYMKKRWDLCPLCFRSLEKGIAKGVKNERNN